MSNVYAYITMNKVDVREAAEIKVSGIHEFIERKVTESGSEAKVDCPREFHGNMLFANSLKHTVSRTNMPVERLFREYIHQWRKYCNLPGHAKPEGGSKKIVIRKCHQ